MQLFVLLILLSTVFFSSCKSFEDDFTDSGRKRKFSAPQIEMINYTDDEIRAETHGNLRARTTSDISVPTVAPTMDITHAPTITVSDSSSGNSGNNREDDDAPVLDESMSNIVTHYTVNVPNVPFRVMKVFNFDKHNDVLDLSKFNFVRREDIPVTKDGNGNEVIKLGKQSIVFVGAGEGTMKIRLGRSTNDDTSQVKTLENVIFALILLFPLSCCTLWWYGFVVIPQPLEPHQESIDILTVTHALDLKRKSSEPSDPTYDEMIWDDDLQRITNTGIGIVDNGTTRPIYATSPAADLTVKTSMCVHEISERLFDATNSGNEVFDVSFGEPSNAPPSQLIDALVSGVERSLTRYTSVEGDYVLRNACRRDFLKRKRIYCTTDQIVVSHGAKQALAQAILAVVKPFSRVIVPHPHWPVFLDLVRMAGAEPVSAPTYKEDGYNLRPEVLKELLDTHQVSGLLLCNPNNPTGSVPSREQLLALVRVLRNYPDVIVISDETYDRIVFDDCVHTSFASLPFMEERTITVTGPSRAFFMTGLRIGFSVSPPEIAKSIAAVQTSITNCATSLAKYATIETYSEGATRWLEENLKELQRKRDLCVDLLSAEPFPLQFNVPQGTYYMFIDVSAYFGGIYTNPLGDSVVVKDSATLSFELLNAHQVAVMPGLAFGMDDHIRLHFAVSEDVLREVISRLKKFLSSLKV